MKRAKKSSTAEAVGRSGRTDCSASELVYLTIETGLVTLVIEAAEENTEECKREFSERYAGYLHLEKNRRIIELYDEQLTAIKAARALLPNTTLEARTTAKDAPESERKASL